MPPRVLGFDASLLVTQFDTLLTTLNETRGMVYKARFCLTSGPNGILYSTSYYTGLCRNFLVESVDSTWNDQGHSSIYSKSTSLMQN